MFELETFKILWISFFTIVIVGCSIGIIIAIKFQNKQKEKYKECLKLIKEKENQTINANNGIDIDKIRTIDESVNVNQLMIELYNLYLEFVDRFNRNSDLTDLLDDYTSEVYKNIIEVHKEKGIFEITDNIELVNYSILEFDKDKLKFRINITCFNYKMRQNSIIYGSNLERVEQIFVITYVVKNKKWVINDIEKVYEKKLGN